MSLSINLNSSGSSNNLHHFQQKPMSISSITSSPLPNSASLVATSPPETNTDMSSPPLSHKYNSRSPNSPTLSYPMSMPNSPDSPTFQHAPAATIQHPHPQYHIHQQQQQRRHMPYHIDQHHQNRHHPYQQRDNNYAASHYPANLHSNSNQYGYYRTTRSSSISSTTSATAPPLTLQERRQRNKAASAKYRAKKNQQHGEMRMLISTLTKENDLLQRQLDHVRRDNDKLKVTCDKLRGKMLAEKMLKKLLHNENQQPGDLQDFVDDEDEDEDDMDDFDEEEDGIDNQYHQTAKSAHRYNDDSDHAYYSTNNQPQPQSNSAFISNTNNNRFDEDIDFEDEDDDEGDDYSDEHEPTYRSSDRTRS